MKKLFLIFILFLVPSLLWADTFTVVQSPVLVNAERIFIGQFNLPNNKSLAQAFSDLVQSTPAPGSQAERLKTLITRSNTTGGQLEVFIQIRVENP